MCNLPNRDGARCGRGAAADHGRFQGGVGLDLDSDGRDLVFGSLTGIDLGSNTTGGNNTAIGSKTRAFAGMSLPLGWNLFRVGILDPQAAQLDTKTWKLKLARVGPGIFFALFGGWNNDAGKVLIIQKCKKETTDVSHASPAK